VTLNVVVWRIHFSENPNDIDETPRLILPAAASQHAAVLREGRPG
jgi:hypothetical protein